MPEGIRTIVSMLGNSALLIVHKKWNSI